MYANTCSCGCRHSCCCHHWFAHPPLGPGRAPWGARGRVVCASAPGPKWAQGGPWGPKGAQGDPRGPKGAHGGACGPLWGPPRAPKGPRGPKGAQGGPAPPRALGPYRRLRCGAGTSGAVYACTLVCLNAPKRHNATGPRGARGATGRAQGGPGGPLGPPGGPWGPMGPQGGPGGPGPRPPPWAGVTV